MDVGLVQAKKLNVVNKTSKTQDERRKEIEVRVAAARLLQQKSYSEKVLEQRSGPDQRTSVKKKKKKKKKGRNVKKNAPPPADWKDSVQSYWNSMTLDMKMNLLKINVSEIKAHFRLSKDSQACQLLSEAISFAEAKKQWKFWACCICSEKLCNSESHLRHVLQEHTSKLSSELQSVLPRYVSDEWIHLLLTCPWKPLDIFATVKMLEKQSNPVNQSECNEISSCKSTFGPGCWPLSDDVEGAKLLQKISSVLQVLIENKSLTENHVSRMIQFAMSELQRLDSVSQLLNFGVDQNPQCICFLRAQELKKVLQFLEGLYYSSRVSWHNEENDFLDDSNNNVQADTTEKVVLDELNLFLLLDENFMPCKVFPSISHDAVTDEGSSTVFASVAHENRVFDAGALLSWIYTGSACGDQLTHWMHTRGQKAKKGIEILQKYEKEFQHLQILCERKVGHLTYEEALQTVEDICIEEGKRREHANGFVYQSYMYLLRKRQEELTGSENDRRVELDLISNILKRIDCFHTGQYELQDILGGPQYELQDILGGPQYDQRLKKFMCKIDSWIVGEIRRRKAWLSDEFNRTEEELLRSLAEMRDIEIQLEPVPAHDYRLILVPLMKSFILAHLKELAEKYAMEKSDAAIEAFLAELALDSKKISIDGDGGAKHDKSKEKKKNKDILKTKKVKAIANIELHKHPKEIAKPMYAEKHERSAN